jgi:hypothetical protein
MDGGTVIAPYISNCYNWCQKEAWIWIQYYKQFWSIHKLSVGQNKMAANHEELKEDMSASQENIEGTWAPTRNNSKAK